VYRLRVYSIFDTQPFSASEHHKKIEFFTIKLFTSIGFVFGAGDAIQ
jgi:hypothetical protein